MVNQKRMERRNVLRKLALTPLSIILGGGFIHTSMAISLTNALKTASPTLATTQLSKSGIAMKKSRSDPQKYLNERRREVLRYVEKKGSFPIAQNWRKYGFTVQEIVERIRKGGHEPNWEKLPIEFRVDENGIPLPDQFCVETATSSTGSEGTRVAMNIASSGRAVADMVRHNERVIEEMEDFVRDLPPEETLLASDADNYREFRRVMDENRGQQVNINPEAIWNLEND